MATQLCGTSAAVGDQVRCKFTQPQQLYGHTHKHIMLWRSPQPWRSAASHNGPMIPHTRTGCKAAACGHPTYGAGCHIYDQVTIHTYLASRLNPSFSTLPVAAACAQQHPANQLHCSSPQLCHLTPFPTCFFCEVHSTQRSTGPEWAPAGGAAGSATASEDAQSQLLARWASA